LAFFSLARPSFSNGDAARVGLAMALLRPSHIRGRTLPQRLLNLRCYGRGVTRDRLDSAGEEYFHYI